jgi:hypothetical protein
MMSKIIQRWQVLVCCNHARCSWNCNQFEKRFLDRRSNFIIYQSVSIKLHHSYVCSISNSFVLFVCHSAHVARFE